MSDPQNLEMRPEEVRSLDEEERHKKLSEANDHVYDERGRWTDSRPPKGVMGKCTMCPSRQDGHTDNPKGTVACQDACDEAGMSAIHFGDLDDPESRPNTYLERRQEVEESPKEKSEKFEDAEDYEQPPAPHPVSQLPTFKLLEDLNTEPNITYVGNQPGANATETPEERPVPYESLSNDWGVKVVAERKEHLDYGARANGGLEEGEGEA
jgi:molybdopterin-containing oxidoreductase family iron-sulfur binding subunit